MRRLPSRAFSTVAVRPINVDHAFVNGAAEAGQTQISLSNGLALSGYGSLSAVPPMADDHFASVSSQPKGRPR